MTIQRAAAWLAGFNSQAAAARLELFDGSQRVPVQRAGGRGMETGGLLGVPIIGAVAGWLAGNSMRGGGFGLVGNIVVGLLGALRSGFLIGFLGISSGGFVGSLVKATLAAPVLLFVLGLINKA